MTDREECIHSIEVAVEHGKVQRGAFKLIQGVSCRPPTY